MLPDEHSAAIGLGGNLGDAPATLIFALRQLAAHPRIRVTAISPLYRSAPIGPAGQADYANAAVTIRTDLSPDALLTALQAIEHLAGRERTLRWGARTLDLDLLLYDNMTLESPHLSIPHRELVQRAFVLVPLHAIASTLILPNGQALATLAENANREGLALWHDTRWDAARQHVALITLP